MKASSIIKSIFIFLFCAVSFSMQGCGLSDDSPVNPVADSGDFELIVKNKTICKVPGAGCKFIVSILPNSKFSGTVKLSVESVSNIDAKLSKTELTENYLETDIVINTSKNSNMGKHIIVVKALHNGKEKQLKLYVEIIGCDTNSSEIS